MGTNFKGYYLKINGCTFQNPQLSSFKYLPVIVQVTDAGTLASGKLNIKVLPHTRAEIDVGFPPMPPEKFYTYWNALEGDDAGVGMRLQVEVYNHIKDRYDTDTFYHNDLGWSVVKVNGTDWLQIDNFKLIGH